MGEMTDGVEKSPPIARTERDDANTTQGGAKRISLPHIVPLDWIIIGIRVQKRGSRMILMARLRYVGHQVHPFDRS